MNAYKDRIAETERVKERTKKLELSEVQGMCLWNTGMEMMSRWRFDMRTHLAVTSEQTSTKRIEFETSTLAKEDQRQQVKNNLEQEARKKLRV